MIPKDLLEQGAPPEASEIAFLPRFPLPGGWKYDFRSDALSPGQPDPYRLYLIAVRTEDGKWIAVADGRGTTWSEAINDIGKKFSQDASTLFGVYHNALRNIQHVTAFEPAGSEAAAAAAIRQELETRRETGETIQREREELRRQAEEAERRRREEEEAERKAEEDRMRVIVPEDFLKPPPPGTGIVRPPISSRPKPPIEEAAPDTTTVKKTFTQGFGWSLGLAAGGLALGAVTALIRRRKRHGLGRRRA